MLNCIMIQGRLVKDPEIKEIPSGLHLCSVMIASERPRKKDGDSVTDFIPAIAWAKTADFIGKYFHRGDMVIISGRMQSRPYEDQEGRKHVAYEISISEVNFCGNRSRVEEKVERKEEKNLQDDYDSINWDEIPDLPEEF